MRIACIYPVVALLLLCGCVRDPAGKTLPEDNAFSFAFLTDIHLQPEQGAGIAFQWAIREVNKLNPDFVITGGDLVMDVLNQSYGRADSLYRMYKDLSGKFRMPVYNTLGNHEVYGWQRMEEGLEQDPEFGKGMFEQRLGPSFYSFDHKGWHFMILDAVFLEGRGAYSGKIDEEQLSWILGDLEKLDKKTPIAISAHFPFISSAFQLTMGPNAAVPEGLLIENSREVLALFSDYNLRLVLQGHLHFLEGIFVQNQVHFITGGAVCGKWWNNDPDSRPEEGFVLFHIEGKELKWEYVDYGWTPRQDL
jgi:3',5'-cyclic AMP phosphodiesterase CpdA